MFNYDINTNIIILTRGDTAALNLSFIKEDGTELEFSKATFSMKNSFDDKDYVLQINANEHKQILFEHNLTQNLNYGSYVYDVELTLIDGSTITPIIGKFKLKPDVTTN